MTGVQTCALPISRLNGKIIGSDEIISHGDRIEIGVTDILFQSEDAPDPDRLAPGAFIGGYLLKKPVAQLTTGAVFEAVQLSMKRATTLQAVAPKLANDRAFAKRFLNDAKQAGKINHPAIAAPIDVGTYQGTLYVVRPDAGKGTLEQIVTANGPLPDAQALSIVRALDRKSVG